MWDNLSLIIYMVVAGVGCFCIKKSKLVENRYGHIKFINRYYLLFFLFWLIFAVYRYVGYIDGVLTGGSDAITYIDFFNVCLGKNKNLYSTHTEPLFQFLTKAIRTMTDDYHVYFAIIYGYILLSYIVFINEFGLLENCYAPVYMLFYLYLKSFCAIRTHLGIATILFALVLMKKEKNILALLVSLCSAFLQRGSIIYAAFPIFYLYSKRHKLTVKKAILFTLLGLIAGFIAQRLLLTGDYFFMENGGYGNYVSSSLSSGYWIYYSRIIVEQLIILALVFLNFRKINMELKKVAVEEKVKAEMLLSMCTFDMMLVPICGILHIWRGVDYFFLPRLIVFGKIITIYGKRVRPSRRTIYYLSVWVIVLAWFIFRLTTLYDISLVMPYRFTLFH